MARLHDIVFDCGHPARLWFQLVPEGKFPQVRTADFRHLSLANASMQAEARAAVARYLTASKREWEYDPRSHTHRDKASQWRPDWSHVPAGA